MDFPQMVNSPLPRDFKLVQHSYYAQIPLVKSHRRRIRKIYFVLHGSLPDMSNVRVGNLFKIWVAPNMPPKLLLMCLLISFYQTLFLLFLWGLIFKDFP